MDLKSGIKNSTVENVMDELLPVLNFKISLNQVKEHHKSYFAVLVSKPGNIIDIIIRYEVIELSS